MGYFPEYFRKEGDKMVAISPEEVPRETHLKEQNFALAERGNTYASPKENATVWTAPGPKAGPFETTLSDGSKVTYYWYRFIDQPSLQSLKLSEVENTKIQKRIEMIHSNWNPNTVFMAPPSQGK